MGFGRRVRVKVRGAGPAFGGHGAAVAASEAGDARRPRDRVGQHVGRVLVAPPYQDVDRDVDVGPAQRACLGLG